MNVLRERFFRKSKRVGGILKGQNNGLGVVLPKEQAVEYAYQGDIPNSSKTALARQYNKSL